MENEPLRIQELKEKQTVVLKETNQMFETSTIDKISLSFFEKCYLDFQKGISLNCDDKELVKLANNLANKEIIAFTTEQKERVTEIKTDLANYLAERQTKKL